MQAIIFANDLKKLVSATKSFVMPYSASAVNRKPTLEYIRLEFDAGKKEVTAIALDGYRMSVETVPCKWINQNFIAYIQPVFPFAMRKDAEVIISVSGDGFCYVEAGNNRAGFRQPGDDKGFPDWRSLIPDGKDIQYKIAFNPDFLLDALKAAKASDTESYRASVVLECRSNREGAVLRSGKNGLRLILPMLMRDRI